MALISNLDRKTACFTPSSEWFNNEGSFTKNKLGNSEMKSFEERGR